jgi:hypothetical protein
MEPFSTPSRLHYCGPYLHTPQTLVWSAKARGWPRVIVAATNMSITAVVAASHWFSDVAYANANWYSPLGCLTFSVCTYSSCGECVKRIHIGQAVLTSLSPGPLVPLPKQLADLCWNWQISALDVALRPPQRPRACILANLELEAALKLLVSFNFFLWRVVSLTPNSQAGGPPLSYCPRLLIWYIRSYPPYLEVVSSIRNLTRRHAIVTRGPPNMG